MYYCRNAVINCSCCCCCIFVGFPAALKSGPTERAVLLESLVFYSVILLQLLNRRIPSSI